MATAMGAGSASEAVTKSNQDDHAQFECARAWQADGVADGALGNLIQAEIIPRLLFGAPASRNAPDGALGREIDQEEAARFAGMPLELEADELLEVVYGFLDRGVPVESIFVDLLAPSARKLGQYWEEDVCDFVDVTMGLWRLQEVMREVTLRYPPGLHTPGSAKAALFTPMPGEQHSFGSLMVEEVFARAGWQSEVLIEPKRKELLDMVASRSFDLVGLTLSCDCTSGAVSELVATIRNASKSAKTQIFIGGRVVNANPGIVAQVGADGTAPDARSALALAESKIRGAQRLNLLVP